MPDTVLTCTAQEKFCQLVDSTMAIKAHLGLPAIHGPSQNERQNGSVDFAIKRIIFTRNSDGKQRRRHVSQLEGLVEEAVGEHGPWFCLVESIGQIGQIRQSLYLRALLAALK